MSSMKDGLGFEEVTNDSNLVTSSQDGYFDNISGNNLQLAGSIITALSITTDDYSTNNYSTNVYGSTMLSGATVKGDTISGGAIRNTNGVLQSVSIGSGTSVYGAKIQAGSAVLSAGSNGWVVYPTAYTGLPSMVVSSRSSLTNVQIVNGSLTAGSAYLLGDTASDVVSWITIGI